MTRTIKKKPESIADYVITLADIFGEYEVYDCYDVQMLQDGRRPEGKDKFISVKDLETFLINQINALNNTPLGQRAYPTSNIEREAMNRLDGEIEIYQTMLDTLAKL